MSEEKTTQSLEAANRSLDCIKLLEGIPADALRDLENKCQWLAFGPTQVVLERSDPDRDVYFIAHGAVRVMIFLGNEREVNLADLQTGDHFGELSAVDGKERSARVVGSEHCVIAVMSRKLFLETLRQFPDVALRLIDNLAAIIRAMNQRVTALSTLSPRQRVYAELLRIAEPNPQADGSWMIPKVPHHDDLAAWSGADKPDVAGAIGLLVREGVIERRNRSYLIKDHGKLRYLATM
jgi:CRP/FNR family cyclic AMP-dependent transcriptional regulator